MSVNQHLLKERKETDELKREALRLGIELPKNSDWWFEDVDNFGGSLLEWELFHDDHTYLTEIGKAGAWRAIKDEKRKNIEWWLRTVGSLVAPLTGLVGALVALLALALAFSKR